MNHALLPRDGGEPVDRHISCPAIVPKCELRLSNGIFGLKPALDTHYDLEALEAMEGRTRATLINKIAGYKTANLIGTFSARGVANLALFNSVVHIGANPPYLGFILRPTTVSRHTYENIRETGCYSINQVTSEMHRQAHCTSGKFPRGTSEFEACGLTPHSLDDFKAPFVAESAIKIGLVFKEEHLLLNGTRLIVGSVSHLYLPEGAVAPDGDVALEKLDTVAIGGLDTYYKGEKLGRYGYYRPGEELKELG
jgi:flavin reductase (DIM6/NTAB) family NADH-FMN oxidoreductase RutF